MTDYNRVSQYVPQRSAYNETLNYMKNHMKFSKDNSSVFEDPFYNIPAHEDLNSVISDTDNLKREHIEFLNGQYDKSTRPDKYRFPLIIKMYYLILNNPHTQGKFVNENNMETFIMFSLQDVMDKFDTYQNIVPVGLKYFGMGHCMMIFMEKKSGSFFYGIDGGANGFDRADRYNTYQSIDPSSIDRSKIKLYRFPQVMNYLKTYSDGDKLDYYNP